MSISSNKSTPRAEGRSVSSPSHPPPPPRLIPPVLTLSSPSSSSSRCLRCKECTGFVSHEWRNSCSLCKCSRNLHESSRTLEILVPEVNNNLRTRESMTSSSDGYLWFPPGLSSGQVEDYMRELPHNKVPKVGSTGEKYREVQTAIQLPKQDFALKYARHIEPGLQQSSYLDFISARNNLALDVGRAVDLSLTGTSSKPGVSSSECSECEKPAKGIAVVAPRLGLDRIWHPACFTCSNCEELLVDLKYCIHDDKLFCERHYAENFKPRCQACDELIFSGQYTRALGKDWHCHHFCCWHCDANLTGNRYVLTGRRGYEGSNPTSNVYSPLDDHPCCLVCFEQNFTHVCRSCEKPIGLDSKDMSYKENHWHEDCFVCGKCGVSLVDAPFAAKESRIFCGPCYDAEFAARCDACGETFKIGHRKMEYKSRKWHDSCFKCASCSAEVGSHSFIIPNEKDVYCLPCFEDKFATKCKKCKKIMTTGGVTFKNEAWHRECFVCCNCNSALAGQKFASRNDKPYCADCFGELFAKRCTACCKPITGEGGTRFISFEGRHWHSQCFVCALCKVSMAGKGFITDGEDIICPDCAKEKLMGAGGGSV